MPEISNIHDISPSAIRLLRKLAPDDQLHLAALDFDMLQDRKTHPDGQHDGAGRFFLTPKYACCVGIRTPSRGFPHSQMVHARTALHVAHSHNLSDRVNDIRSYRRLMQAHPELRLSAATALSVISAHEARKAVQEIQASSQKNAFDLG